jgi:hypothetical protein
LAASVDHTEARNEILGCFGRSDRFLADLERRYPGSTGSAPARTDAQVKRPKPVISGTCVRSPPDLANPSSRTDAHRSVSVRTPTATRTVTELLPEMLPDDPDLATVVDAWDRLPEVVRAGIVAMVRAAARK